jgi:hypothetical protein
MKSHHDLFAAQSLFNEALSGEFHPPTDLLRRAHRLSRLAFTVAQRGDPYKDFFGRVHPEGQTYTPSWANESGAELWLPGDAEPFARQLIIGERCGRHPRQISFTHEPTRMASIAPKDYLVVRDSKGEEEAAYHISALGPDMDRARNEIAERAQDFYDGLKPNR